MPKNEYEIVEHAQLNDVKIFIVDIANRNLHMHKEFELCYVLEGEITVYSQRKHLMFQKGDFILFNPKQPHDFHTADQSRAIILSLQVSPRFCIRYFPSIQNVEFDLINLNQVLEQEQLAILNESLISLAEYYFRGDSYFELRCYAQINNLFLDLLQRIPWHLLTENEKAAKHNTSERLNRILDYIENHYTEKILLTDIARAEKLSLFFLSHYLRDYLNMSFQDYIALLRFNEACNLMEHTNMQMTDIAIACGFSDNRYLNKMFQKHLGCKPSEYRIRYLTDLTTSNAKSIGINQRIFSLSESLAYLYNFIP